MRGTPAGSSYDTMMTLHMIFRLHFIENQTPMTLIVKYLENGKRYVKIVPTLLFRLEETKKMQETDFQNVENWRRYKRSNTILFLANLESRKSRTTEDTGLRLAHLYSTFLCPFQLMNHTSRYLQRLRR